MKKNRIHPLPLLLIFTFLLVLGYGIYVIVVTNRARTNFHRSPEADSYNSSYTRLLPKVKSSDFDLKIAGLDGDVTFTAPYAFSYKLYGIKYTITRGEEITTDFVSISVPGMGKVTRAVTLTVKGRSDVVTLTATELSRLYRIALRQNGLTEQFEADFGAPLTRPSSRNALRVIDKQLYDQGIMNPRDYPYDQNALMSLLVFGVFGLPLILIVASTLLTIQLDNMKYRKYLKEYNREHKESWDGIAGTLPQFESLRRSGISMEALPQRKKKTFLDTLKDQFRPIR